MFVVFMTYSAAHPVVVQQCRCDAMKRALLCTALHMQVEQPCPAGECVVWGS
ncbi:MAG: hypothetical protein ACK4WH_02785 [Phycisphaerales bacterium]